MLHDNVFELFIFFCIYLHETIRSNMFRPRYTKGMIVQWQLVLNNDTIEITSNSSVTINKRQSLIVGTLKCNVDTAIFRDMRRDGVGHVYL
jgi:hypothetical protein